MIFQDARVKEDLKVSTVGKQGLRKRMFSEWHFDSSVATLEDARRLLKQGLQI